MSDNAESGQNRIVDPDPDRERGILTAHDRAFLRDRSGDGVRAEMSDNAIRQKRHKIRQRFRNALIDVQYLLLLGGDLTEIFSEDGWEEYDLGRVHGSIFAAAFQLVTAHTEREKVIEEFESMVMNDVIFEYATEEGELGVPSVEVSVEMPEPDERVPLEAVRQRVESGEDLPYPAHLALEWAGMHPSPGEYHPSEIEE